MNLQTRLLIKKIPGVHSLGSRCLDVINAAYYQQANRQHHYTERIRALQGVFAGERCFIVGNGPSLRPADLDLIQNEISFASNLIFEAYGGTRWRPTYYFAQDVYDTRLRDHVEQLDSTQAFIGAYFLRRHRIQNDKVIAFLGKKSRSPSHFADDCAIEVAETATVTFTMLQFAFYLGFTTIYLLGIDNTYRNVVDSNNNVITNEEITDHFYPSRSGHVSYANVNEMTRAYEVSRQAAHRRGVRIFNSTRGGALEVFPRVPLEDAIGPAV